VVSDLENSSFCYVTTTGRVTGRPHEIEIWYALHGSTVYLMSGGGRRSDWVRNLLRHPDVAVRIGDRTMSGRARIVADADEDRLARTLVYDKYSAGYSGDLQDWRESSLPVAIDLSGVG
jgi:deazaflavin-dependent oxidoreductase (nitroreductase family)